MHSLERMDPSCGFLRWFIQSLGVGFYRNGRKAKSEVIRNNLTREIKGGGDPFVALGQRMRDRGFKNGLIDEFQLFDRSSAFEVSMLAGTDLESSDEFEAFLRTAYSPHLRQLKSLSEERKKYGDT